MTLNDVIRKTLTTMKESGTVLTPQNYQEAFCKEAKKVGIVTEDCNMIEKYIAKLDKSLKKELSNYPLRTTEELFTFLTSKIGRMEPNACQNELKSIKQLVKRMSDVAFGMHDKDLSDIASYTISHIEEAHSSSNIDLIKDKWMDFLTTYDDSYLDKLLVLGSVDKEDIRKSVNAMMAEFTIDHDLHIPDHIGKLLIASLVPSIASSMNDEIAMISSQIRQDSNVLDTSGMQEDIKFAIKKRIELDKSALKETVYQLDEIADEVSMRLLSIIEQSESKKEELGSIKKELENVKIDDNKSYKAIHEKLLNIATLLERETTTLHTEVKSQQTKISVMDKKIALLEGELSDVTKESREDFLTKLFNKRALEEKLHELDSGYKRYGRDYTVLFLDIDFFKKINDTYGHDAGDAVLKVFAKVLKKQSRDNDFVARFGGEEFVMVLPETTFEGTKQFATKLRLVLQKNRFVYKDQRISLTVSGGISQRSQWDNNAEMIKEADSSLYQAKETGRNKILPE